MRMWDFGVQQKSMPKCSILPWGFTVEQCQFLSAKSVIYFPKNIYFKIDSKFHTWPFLTGFPPRLSLARMGAGLRRQSGMRGACSGPCCPCVNHTWACFQVQKILIDRNVKKPLFKAFKTFHMFVMLSQGILKDFFKIKTHVSTIHGLGIQDFFKVKGFWMYFQLFLLDFIYICKL